MFELLRDMFQGMHCPVCGKRGLVGVANRWIEEGIQQGAMVNPRYAVARCRRCRARCIKDLVEDAAFRPATADEWGENAYEPLPPARAR